MREFNFAEKRKHIFCRIIFTSLRILGTPFFSEHILLTVQKLILTGEPTQGSFKK